MSPDSKDSYTEGHSERVSNYAELLADKLGVSVEEKERIKKASLLHDLAKIGVPDKVLNKKGSLNDDEFAIIKEHPVLGAKILKPIEQFKDIIPYVLYHHESYDGSGYPHGISGDSIPFGARIIAVADVFDALTTGRSYRDAFPLEDAIKELEKIKGIKLDPYLTDIFLQIVRERYMSD